MLDLLLVLLILHIIKREVRKSVCYSRSRSSVETLLLSYLFDIFHPLGYFRMMLETIGHLSWGSTQTKFGFWWAHLMSVSLE